MKKFFLLILMGLFFLGHPAETKELEFREDDLDQYRKRESFVSQMESGRLKWFNFVDTIQTGELVFRDFSPSAIANYMEAFANEGILDLIPNEYFRNEEIKIALNVVFEDRVNVANNQNVYEDYFNRVVNNPNECL
jgi:hypothetical protein